MCPAPTAGKYIYIYQNEQCPHGYENIEVTKEQLDILIAEDKKEYSNNRRHDEKHTDLWEDYHDAFEEEPEEDDNGGVRYFSPKKVAAMVRRQWQQSDDFTAGELDRKELVKTFDDRDLAIYSLAVEKKIKQNKVAELLNLSEATVSRRVKVILQKIIKEDMDFGIYSKSRLDAEADYKYYRISGETDSFTDVKVWLFLTQLNRDMVIRYLYCMFGTYQLFHYCYIFLYRFTDKMAELDMNRLLGLLEPYSRLLYERHTRKFGPAFKMLFIFLELKCAANLKKVGLYEKSAIPLL